MNTRRIWSMLLIVVILGIAAACQQEDEITPELEESEYLSETDLDKMTVLGDQLENPYTVENMRRAYDNLKSSTTYGSTFTRSLKIEKTHLYVKFMPLNDDQLTILESDSLLDLYNYPLDYEVVKVGSFYQDPSIPLDKPTYKYASVPVNYKLPGGVEYEILAELFIPDDGSDKIANDRMIVASEVEVELLVDEALRITNNVVPLKQARTEGSSWRPAGRIRVWDNSVTPNNWRPVEGVEVKARRWFTTHKGITNSQGNYSCNGTFKRDANYSLDWERYHFAIREGWLNGANINGPKMRGNWNLDLNSGANMFHARIFVAAYHYYYKNIKGLRRPPLNGFFKTQLKIRAYNESNSEINGSHSAGRRFLGLGSAIKIYNPSRPMIEIYGTTIHELAHASHWDMGSSDYNNAEDKVAESWARGVQWELVRMVYTTYPGGPTIRPNYTQVVLDMIDGTSDVNNGSEILSQDNVSGYNIRQIEDALNGQRTWTGWRNNIKNSYVNGTENNLDALFNHWN